MYSTNTTILKSREENDTSFDSSYYLFEIFNLTENIGLGFHSV